MEAMAAAETDGLLVRQVRAGDAGAWRQLIERFEGRLLAFVDSRLRDRAATKVSKTRQHRILQSSQHLLGSD